MGRLDEFLEKGWVKVAFDPVLARWAEAAREPALAVANDPDWQRDWLRHDGTWFVGVHALSNDADGAVGGVPLEGAAVAFARGLVREPFDWDRAQVSVCYRGYPRRWGGESEGAHRYRLRRDAAHVDGLHRGPAGERLLQEYHQFLLGVPLGSPPAEAAPFVVWEGSHKVMQEMFHNAFADVPANRWHEIDVADAYQAARRRVFEDCPRIELPVGLGEATVVHRHALHGMAPWPDDLDGPDEGRMIAYFRPEGDMDRTAWLRLT